ncbi:hypothetical protein JCM10212_000874 [Sporobolomyces blumeae]
MSTSLLRLPSELIRQIAGCIDNLSSLSAFSRTSKQLFACAKRDLYRTVRVTLVYRVDFPRGSREMDSSDDAAESDSGRDVLARRYRYSRGTLNLLARLEAGSDVADLIKKVEFCRSH